MVTAGRVILSVPDILLRLADNTTPALTGELSVVLCVPLAPTIFKSNVATSGVFVPVARS